MTTETMTIYKALCELKTLNQRIYKEIANASFVGHCKSTIGKVLGAPKKEFEDKARAAHDKITALINRRNAIKRAVILSNATTLVTIGDKSYTVAEAIDMKTNGYMMLDELNCKMRNEYEAARKMVDKEMGPALDKKVDEYIKSLFGKEGTQVNPDSVQKARDAFIAANAYEIVDPMKVPDLFTVYENERARFMDQVDSAISVSNAVTSITIDY